MRWERKSLLLWALAVAFIVNLPYLLAWAWTPPGHRFMGHIFNPDEPNVYLAWIRQHAEGRILARDPFTTEGPQFGFFNLFLFALGVMSRLLRLDPIWLWHASRVGGCFALLFAAHALARRLSEHPFFRRYALSLVVLSSGWGWLQALGFPLEATDYRPRLVGLITPETVNFLSLMINPLFSLSIALELWALSAWLDALRARRLRTALGCGLILLLLGNLHTYDLPVMWLAIALHSLALCIWERSLLPVKLGMVAFLVSLPAAGGQALTFFNDPVFREKALTPTPVSPLPVLVATFGFLGIGAVAGSFWAARDRRGLLLLSWVISALVVSHLPLSFQRKALEGMQCALAFLTATAWTQLLLMVRGRGMRLTFVRSSALAFLILTAPSNVLFFADVLRNVRENNAVLRPALMPRFYLSEGQVEAAKFIEREKRFGDVALAVPTYANYLPRLAGITVFAGHWAETLRYAEKVGMVGWVYDSDTPEAMRQAFLHAHRIRFVLYGPEEREYGLESPAEGGWAQLVAEFGDTEVYEVR